MSYVRVRYIYGVGSWRLKQSSLLRILLVLAVSTYGLLISLPPAFRPAPINAGGNYVSGGNLFPTEGNKPEQSDSNHIFIPALNTTLIYQTGDKNVLNNGGWHRFPERGGPGQGNFIVAAHRFQTGSSRAGTIKKSPLYHMDKLSSGDKLVVWSSGQQFVYEVIDNFSVEPDDLTIETPSREPIMTLYSCLFSGAADGRYVIRAKLTNPPV